MLGRRKKRIAGRCLKREGALPEGGMALPGDVYQEHGGVMGKSRRENEIEKARQDIMLACLEDGGSGGGEKESFDGLANGAGDVCGKLEGEKGGGAGDEIVEKTKAGQAVDESLSADETIDYKPTDAEIQALLTDIEAGEMDGGDHDVGDFPGKYLKQDELDSFVDGLMSQIVASDIEEHCRRIRARSEK
ncbi:MAG: hypothetical protein K9M57_11285 [Phycisphaerae bacterium]|nr:hypothetical protein [Phycisphaerae bacterium]